MAAADPVVHVVDDDPAVRDSVTGLIRLFGLAVEAHASAEAFLAATGARGCGCVVADVNLPGVSGLELLRRVRARRDAVPFILMTGRVTDLIAAEAAQAGARLLEKPFDPGELVGLVRAAIGAG